MTNSPHGLRIYVAGHRGMVGSAIVRALRAQGHDKLILRTHEELDLLDQAAVCAFYRDHKPDWAFLAAARVGGIHANNIYRARFIYENLQMQCNLIHGAFKADVQRLLFLGSSCIYPRRVSQPMKEEQLLTGPLEPTNQPYAIAKIAGIEMCDAYHRQHGVDFRAAMPTNLYGPGDNFDLETSHVIPALLRKFHEAKQLGQTAVTVWGSGKPRREFLHVDDLAEACVFLMELSRRSWDKKIGSPFVNVGCGEDLSVAELVQMIREVVGYQGEIVQDTSKPDGTPRKLLDVSRMRAAGWSPSRGLRDGLEATYHWFREHSSRGGPARGYAGPPRALGPHNN